MNVGLIIQGPLLSVGKDGKNAHVRKVDMNESRDFIRFDCRQNIQKIVNDYGYLFESIVVSTWKNELKPEDKWDRVSIVSAPDPGEVERDRFSPRSRNKYRQFVGILSGIKEFNKNNKIDYVLRIRTDQYLDLKKLLEDFFQKLDNKKPTDKLIGVPFARSNDFFVHDLYLISSIKTLEKFCNDIVAFDQFEFILCVHREMLLKHAFGSYKKEIGVVDPAYFPYWPPCGSSRSTKRIFSFMFDKVFLSLDRSIFESVVWRGTLLSHVHIRAQYLGNVNNKKTRRKNLVNIPNIVSINWKYYFNFKRRKENKKLSLGDRILIKAGEFAWKQWNVIRNLSNNLYITSFVYKLFR